MLLPFFLDIFLITRNKRDYASDILSILPLDEFLAAIAV
jgi:hypothetical protein